MEGLFFHLVTSNSIINNSNLYKIIDIFISELNNLKSSHCKRFDQEEDPIIKYNWICLNILPHIEIRDIIHEYYTFEYKEKAFAFIIKEFLSKKDNPLILKEYVDCFSFKVKKIWIENIYIWIEYLKKLRNNIENKKKIIDYMDYINISNSLYLNLFHLFYNVNLKESAILQCYVPDKNIFDFSKLSDITNEICNSFLQTHIIKKELHLSNIQDVKILDYLFIVVLPFYRSSNTNSYQNEICRWVKSSCRYELSTLNTIIHEYNNIMEKKINWLKKHNENLNIENNSQVAALLAYLYYNFYIFPPIEL